VFSNILWRRTSSEKGGGRRGSWRFGRKKKCAELSKGTKRRGEEKRREEKRPNRTENEERQRTNKEEKDEKKKEYFVLFFADNQKVPVSRVKQKGEGREQQEDHQH